MPPTIALKQPGVLGLDMDEYDPAVVMMATNLLVRQRLTFLPTGMSQEELLSLTALVSQGKLVPSWSAR